MNSSKSLFFKTFYLVASLIPILGREVFVKVESMVQRDSFINVGKADRSALHEVLVSLKLKNLRKLEQHVLDSSTPGNANYQKWISFDEVGVMTSNPTAYLAMRVWLEQFESINISWVSPHQNFMKVSAPIATWESLFNTSFYRWKHYGSNGELLGSHLRSKSYSLPSNIAPHVQSIFYTCQPFPNVRGGAHLKEIEKGAGGKARSFRPEATNSVNVAFLNSFYGIPSNVGSTTLGQAVFQTDGQSFSQEDLTSFQSLNNIPRQAALTVGGNQYSISSSACSTNRCGEGNLDIQYIMGISQKTPSVFWYVDNSNIDPFLGFVTALASSQNPPTVNSISWGSIEAEMSPSVMDAFNAQAMKLAAMGVSVFVSSGDDGVVNFGCANDGKSGTQYSNNACFASSSSSTLSWSTSQPWTGKGYFPSFPASSPWVTAVGATMGANTGGREVACQSDAVGGVITTGGGFSMYNAAPSWQTSAVSNYFAAVSKQPPAVGYNIRGRGYPDVSLLGVNYPTVIGGKVYSLYGTSASAPVFAAMVSLVNSARQKEGKSTVGFINPTIYSKSSLFNDVTSGNNKCCAQSTGVCCGSGFYAASGWDPVTGLGSITYSNLYTILSNVNSTRTSQTSESSSSSSIDITTIIIAVVVSVGGVIVIACLVSLVMSSLGTAYPSATALATPNAFVASHPPLATASSTHPVPTVASAAALEIRGSDPIVILYDTLQNNELNSPFSTENPSIRARPITAGPSIPI